MVIFTDLLGGSINNSAVSVLMRHRNVFVVAGINLTLLLEFLLCEEATTEAAIIYATSAARESIVFINPLITQPSSDPQENLMIKLVRIDYRLLHGRWFCPTRALDIDHIIVANAKAAADAFITMSLNSQSQRASRWTSPPLNRRRKSLTAASWIIKVMVVLGNTAETLALVEKSRN
nr:EIIAB-Man [Klebsiella pneumoniae]